MRVAEIWRYPIKSVGGEQLADAEITLTGIRHDRGWGIVDDTTGNVLTARREPRLLMGSARIDGGAPVVTIEGGRELRDSAEFSEWLGRPVTLARAADAPGGTYEVPLDFENDADWVSWKGPDDAWHDSGASRVSLVSAATLGSWDFAGSGPTSCSTAPTRTASSAERSPSDRSASPSGNASLAV